MSSDDDSNNKNYSAIMNVRVTNEQRLAIDAYCKNNNTTVSKLFRKMLDAALSNKNTNITDNNFSLSPAKMTEETMVAMIYFEFTVKNQPFNVIVETLSEIHNVSVSFVLHCMGKMLLSGIKLNEIKL